MKRPSHFTAVMLLATSFVVGCEKEPTTPAAAPKPATTQSVAPLIPMSQLADWCPEHGVPESICLKCNTSLVAAFKEKGDWCAQHSTAESQCVQCHPELKEKFAAAYKEKYGKDAPAVP